MSKGKASKGKSSKPRKGKADPSRVQAAPAAETTATSPTGPVGQWFYDMPYSAPAPRLINPELGLHNLVTRAGHNAGYTIDVTLLDAPDHRLIRSGILLAHRVLDGRGEWYLGANDWQPLLPKERIEPMSHADLPEEFADLVKPFRRRGTLGPVAALSCERREFALRDDRGTTMALLRDDKVTVRRGGLTTARFREVLLTPTGPGLTDEQAAHVAHALSNAGANQVTRFPRLVTRLGAPATGLTDFPAPQEVGPDAPFALFVSNLLATRLRRILCADLAIRTRDPRGAVDLAAQTALLRTELKGLSTVIDWDWIEDLDEELQWIVGQAEQESLRREGQPERESNGDLRQRLRGERYLTLLERLVTATRAPRVASSSASQASDVLGALLDTAQDLVVKTSGRLTVDSPAETWDAASGALDDLFRAIAVAGHLLPGRAEELRHLLEMPTQLLGEASRHRQLAQRSRDLAAGSTAQEAFDLGRAYEHELAGARMARDAFVRQWSKTAKKLER